MILTLLIGKMPAEVDAEVDVLVKKSRRMALQTRPSEIEFVPSRTPSDETAIQRVSRETNDRKKYEFELALAKNKLNRIAEFEKAIGKFKLCLNDELSRKPYVIHGETVGEIYDSIWTEFNITKLTRAAQVNERLYNLRLTAKMTIKDFIEEVIDLYAMYEELDGAPSDDQMKKAMVYRLLINSDNKSPLLVVKLQTLDTVQDSQGNFSFEKYCESLKKLDNNADFVKERYDETPSLY